MRSYLILVGVLATGLATSQCSGGSSSTPASPSPTPSPSPTTLTISIVGTLGNGSYRPNPVPVAAGGQLMFKNDDTEDHRVIMDDGSVDFGTLSPGASSQARSLSSGSFHCTIHPSMVGAINAAEAPDPEPGSGDGY